MHLSAKHCCKNLMHWLLVLALVFSPLQSAMAAFASDCSNATGTSGGSEVMAAYSHDNMQMAGGMQAAACCDHDCCDDGGAVCSHGCSQLHAWTVLPLTGIELNTGLRNILHTHPLISYIGQIPPSLFRPPRSSV